MGEYGDRICTIYLSRLKHKKGCLLLHLLRLPGKLHCPELVSMPAALSRARHVGMGVDLSAVVESERGGELEPATGAVLG